MAALIAARRAQDGIPHAVACRALGVSRPWFYKHKDGCLSPRGQRRERLKAEVARLFSVVSDTETLGIFLRVGGNALVEKSLAEHWLAHVLEPIECIPGPMVGLRPLHAVPRTSLAHAPSKKLRMDVLRRDDFRCRICGRRAADYVDIELHVHHIRPHGIGGLTEADNLITLCHTCHTGLDPHLELGLFGMLPGGFPLGDIEGAHDRYTEGVRRYRSVAARLVAEAARKAPGDH